MIDYFLKHYDTLLEAFWQHLLLVGEILAISIVIAGAVSYFLIDHIPLFRRLISVCGAIYSIPSLALFALLLPLCGLGNGTAVPVLVAYNQYLLLRNFLAGLEGVEPGIVEAAIGMGMSKWQMMLEVRVPLAMPAILSGVRLAIISTTGIATIAAAVHAGGLGNILFSGLRSMNIYKIAWGTILCMVIALGADGLFGLLSRRGREKE
ncbi:MAG: ABC transporter permease [Lachnospiraceae bacterium]|nr:ABC transporter permease [Lachnospiraceae bacterium]